MRVRDGSKQGREQVYQRRLPGGGFVAIEVTALHSRFRSPKYRGEIVVERRADQERRVGHVAPVVAEVEASTIDSVIHKLFPLAQSNTEIAIRCLARTRQSDAAIPSHSPA